MSLKYAAISASTNGDNTIVAAVAGKILRVLSYVLVGGGAVSATWKSDVGGGAVALTGAMPLVAQTVVSSGPAPATATGKTVGHFETAAGKALNLNLSAGVLVAGHLTYDEVLT